jgi:isopentenyl diphosphate isomerase/L-lactate dehydrogenase-like FMN-dependent dehydrogenase
MQMLRSGSPRWANLPPPQQPGQGATFSFNATFKRAIGWHDVERIRALWTGPLVLKGLQSPADVIEAAARGVDGIVLSNHGGRQLEGACAPIERLADAVASAGSRVTVMIDSGFRRGGEVVKALALGAKAVWLGRAPLYGLATRGEPGVRDVLEIFRDEMSRTMMLLGARSLAELGPHHVAST